MKHFLCALLLASAPAGAAHAWAPTLAETGAEPADEVDEDPGGQAGPAEDGSSRS